MLKHIILLTLKKVDISETLVEELNQHQIRLWTRMPEEDLPMEECLFLTDMPPVGKALLLQKAGVLLWLNEKNRREDTGAFPYAVEKPEEIEFSYLDKVYRRFQGLPWEIARTDRCIIREMKEGDLDALYELYRDKEISRYTEDLYEDREKEKEYICSYIEHAYTFWGFGTWIVERKEDHKLIGRVGFNLREGYEDPELGFVIGLPWQRQGLAYEVCTAALKVGKEEYGFTCVQALVQEENLASAGLLEKLGFSLQKKIMEQGQEYLFYKIQLAFG